MLYKYQTDEEIVEKALQIRPSLIIDCSNKANPLKYVGEIDVEELEEVYLIEVEMLYKYRDVIKSLPKLILDLKPRLIGITCTNYLFNYNNEHENKKIKAACNKLIKQLSLQNDIVVRY